MNQLIVLLLLILSMVSCEVETFDNYPWNYAQRDDISLPIDKYLHPLTNERTAVIISGQLRSGNYSFKSGTLI